MPKKGNNIYHRVDGRWEGRYYCKGSKKYRSVYGKTYTEANVGLRPLLDGKKDHLHEPPANACLKFYPVIFRFGY